VVRSFFRYLVKSDVLLYDPAASLELPKRKGILPRSVLSKKEMARLLAAPDATTPLGLRDRAMLEVLYSTGIRNAELRALQLYDLDLDRGLLRINDGKNAKDRVVPLGEVACAFLREYLAEARPKLLSVRGGAGEAKVFLSKNGRPLLPLGVIVPIHKHAKAAGIERPVTPHTLRHTFATHLLAGRADIRHIQAMLGHTSVATTQIYTRVEVTDLKAVHHRCHPREKR
jgi:integrase/recombinase XerD